MPFNKCFVKRYVFKSGTVKYNCNILHYVVILQYTEIS